MTLFLAITILLAGTGFGQSALSAASPEVSALQKAAEDGDSQAEFALGQAYDFGKGIAQNDTAAYTWYHKAAEQDTHPLRMHWA